MKFYNDKLAEYKLYYSISINNDNNIDNVTINNDNKNNLITQAHDNQNQSLNNDNNSINSPMINKIWDDLKTGGSVTLSKLSSESKSMHNDVNDIKNKVSYVNDINKSIENKIMQSNENVN
jgi:hypothetical protein